MFIFFAKERVDSDKYIQLCYELFRMNQTDNLSVELPEKIEIIRKTGFKPLLSADKVHFSLSHSASVMMCAMSFDPVGVDIEKIKDIEYDKFDFVDATNLDDFFFKWTRVESYLKYKGTGLCEIRNKDIQTEIDDNMLEQFPVFGDYVASVYSNEQNIRAFEIDISEIR